MEQYLALTQGNQAPGMVKPEIGGNVNFEIKSQFMRELRKETFFKNKNDDAHEHMERVLDIVSLFNIPRVSHDVVMLCVFPITLTGVAKRWIDRLPPGTERDETLYQVWEWYNDLLYKCPTHDINNHQKVNIFYNGLGVMNRQLLDSQGPIPSMTPVQALTVIHSMADHSQKNLGRDIKKLKENINAIQVGCQNREGAHLDKDCPLKKEIKSIEEAKYGEFGRPSPFINGAKYRIGPPGYYTRMDNRPPVGEKRPSLEEPMKKHLEESTRRRTEMEEWVKKLQENAKINTRNQDASLKNLETQIEQLTKEFHTKASNEINNSSLDQEDERRKLGINIEEYDPPMVYVETFKVKRYSFDTSQSFIYVTKELMDAFPMGRENGSRFRDMIRSLYKEMKFKVSSTRFYVVEMFCIAITTKGKRGGSIETLQEDNSCNYHSEKIATIRGGPSEHFSKRQRIWTWNALKWRVQGSLGITSSKDYAVTYSNEEISHHSLYSVKPLLLYAATFKFTRDDLSEGMWDRKVSIGQTSNENLGLSTLESLIELMIEHCIGKCNRIIGSEIVRKSLPFKEISIWIEASSKSLDKYALEILKKHGIERCESLGTPLATKPKLDADLIGTPVDQIKYCSMIESLMYLTSSKLDLVQAILKGYHKYGTLVSKDSGFELTAFSDVDHTRCIDTRKSTFREIQFLGDKLVSWMLKKQDYTAMSSTKAKIEYQLADMLNQAIPQDQFEYLVRRIGMRCLTPAELEVLANESA
nr:hypothetical protein [Tanacetum cinerariifolium]